MCRHGDDKNGSESNSPFEKHRRVRADAADDRDQGAARALHLFGCGSCGSCCSEVYRRFVFAGGWVWFLVTEVTAQKHTLSRMV